MILRSREFRQVSGHQQQWEIRPSPGQQQFYQLSLITDGTRQTITSFDPEGLKVLRELLLSDDR